MRLELLRDCVRSAGEKLGSNAAIAEASGVSEATISRFLAGKSGLSLEAFEGICDWLGRSMDDFRGDPVASEVDQKLAAIADRLRSMAQEFNDAAQSDPNVLMASVILDGIAIAIEEEGVS